MLDPLQAYLGCAIDMNRPNEVRSIAKPLSAMAERTGCAVILIGHLNKAQGTKSAYRGLGSIDFRAAARSVLLVGRVKENPNIRIVAHDKSSLAPAGKAVALELNDERGFIWHGHCDVSVDDVLSGNGNIQTKTSRMESELREMLRDGPVSSEAFLQKANELGVSERTVKIAKQNLGVKSMKRGGGWFSSLPDGEISRG